jgi:aldehyde dehydrogenase (NAD+)
MTPQATLDALHVSASSGDLVSHSPIDGGVLGRVGADDALSVALKIGNAHKAFLAWRAVPAPRRGELVRLWGEVLRERKAALGALVTLEAGKIVSEGLGEAQEMIDICDFAVGLSRQLYGVTIASERAGHHLVERWHPLGVVGVISAFNFPVAVYAWNAALALVCGDAVVWKPSEKTPLCAAAVMETLHEAMRRFGDVPEGLVVCVQGGAESGAALVAHPCVALVSATGSTRMGHAIAASCARQLKRTLLELGGNAAMIVAPSADLEMAVRAIAFGAVGTAGQRCTTLRRLIAHESVRETLLRRLKCVYASLKIGDPREAGTHVGPLIDTSAFASMQGALVEAKKEGGAIFGGEREEIKGCECGFYVRPALALMPSQTAIVRTETFAPILYVLGYSEFAEAIRIHNDVPQGLSSCIFTTDMREAEEFISATGSDCGIANVNSGPSGAEIGGAFGGEKDTGGGRESGSDAWRAYMRRQTQTVNYSRALPLAQGVRFDVGA